MKRLAQFLVILILAGAGSLPSAFAKKQGRLSLSPKVVEAKSALIVCECPRGMAVAEGRALEELQLWGRFQIVKHRDKADLVFLFSANQYLGDYLTRDGPDKRPVSVDFTIMTVVDPSTGENLWSDSRRWGSWRVDHATRELIAEFRQRIEGQTKKWALNDILMCSVSPDLAAFANLTAEQALAKSGSGVSRIAGSPDRLTLDSPEAPDFCRQAQLVVGPDNRIVAFDVPASLADSLDLTEVLQQADRFDFAGGKDTDSNQVYFNAQSKDKKILIRFEVQGHKSVLSWVRYSY
ncbi:MAG: hypothetical protein WA383_17455 [Terriglobales bacterium]|jgi:hypothetical protein